ncbi:unnamed protein product [Closterium sp. NIES-64]|nr:unnamed protein product [Closterium sp. NIES-64]
MGALTSLIFYGCYFSGLPWDIGQLQNLVTMKLFSTRLLHLPDSFGQLGKLKELTIYECYDLFELPASFTNLSSLETLLIYGGSSLIDLPLGFENLSKLRRLELLNCAMPYLPDRFGELLSLEILILQTTDTYKRIGVNFEPASRPAHLGYESEGEEFELDGSCSLRAFPGTFSLLTRLEQLIIDGCEMLEELPSGMGNLRSLKVLKVENCKRLKVFPMPGSIGQAGLGRLSSLVHLHIVNTNLPALPENLGDLKELAVLLLEKCHAITSLPSSMVTLPKLQQINLKTLPLLTHLPENLGQLKALNELVSLQGCKALRALPSDLGSLSCLREVDLDVCTQLKELPGSLVDRVNVIQVKGSWGKSCY